GHGAHYRWEGAWWSSGPKMSVANATALRWARTAAVSPGCALIHACALAVATEEMMVEQHVSIERRPLPVVADTTTAGPGWNTAAPPVNFTVTGWPVCGSVEVIVASRSSMAGMPRASMAHMAYARTAPSSTRCLVGVGENGYAATSRPSGLTATRS